MAVRQKVTVSVQPAKQRPSSAERRAAQIATVSTRQAELKREAAERRAKRALNSNAPAASMPRESAQGEGHSRGKIVIGTGEAAVP